METRFNYKIICNIMILYTILSNTAWAITIDDIINKCQFAESTIQDITLEYEWYNLPPFTYDELIKSGNSSKVLLPKDGIRKFKLSASRILDEIDANVTYSSYRWRLLSEETTILLNNEGGSWEEYTKFSYNGQLYKKYNKGGWPNTAKSGVVFSKGDYKGDIMLSPIGFSIFRLANDIDGVPLSERLKYKETVRINDTISKINDFNTIYVDLLQEYTKQPCIRVYFSVDHDYTPIKYDYFNSGKSGITLIYSVEVQSLDSIGDKIWFPSSGIIQVAKSQRADAFRATNNVIANKGLKKEDFNFEFPPETKVSDQISSRQYIVGSESK